MNIITGKTGTPHVTSQQAREINMGIAGNGNYVLNVGNALRSETVSNNTIRIYDGVLMLQGCAASIDANTYEDMTISNGTQGAGRIDLICARYQKHTDTGTESVELVVIEGTPAVNPTVPAVNTGEIRENDVTVDFPLYRVRLDGINTPVVEKLFTAVSSLEQLKENADAQYNSLQWLIGVVNGHRNGQGLIWNGYNNNVTIDLGADYYNNENGLYVLYQYGDTHGSFFLPNILSKNGTFNYTVERFATNGADLRRVSLKFEIASTSLKVTHDVQSIGTIGENDSKPLTVPEEIWAQAAHLYVTHVYRI